jgi:hypothetical protein
MWNVKYIIIPVTIGANEIVSNSLKENVEAMQGKQSVDTVQNTAVLGASHIIREVLQAET